MRDCSLQSLMMGFLAATIGFSSAFAVVLQGFRGVGATEAQAASGLMAVSIAMGLGAIFLSLKDRMPIWIAWSTPGSALLATSAVPEGGFAEAVGAFIVSGALIVLAGLIRPVTRAVAAIPIPIASAMLAGVLMGLCLSPFKAIAFDPKLGLPIFLAWAITSVFRPRLAVLSALVAFVLVLIFGVEIPEAGLQTLSDAVIPDPQFVSPVFTLESAISIGVPLFIVTMASQNIPGLAVLKTYDYPLKPGLWFPTTGLLSMASASIGGHAVNLAAITAAMCASEEAHPEKSRRYWAAVMAGIVSVGLGLLAGLVTAFVTLAPAILIEGFAGLALIGTFVTATQNAFRDETARIPAATTFLLTASGVSIAGISGAFWGLIAGIALLSLTKLKR